MPFARFARYAVLALPLVLGSQAQAVQITYGTYYDETLLPADCGNPGPAGQCTAWFSRTPADKLLKVTHVSCSYSAGAIPFDLVLSVAATVDIFDLGRQYHLDYPQASKGVSNTQMAFLVGQGRYPFVRIYTQAQTAIRITCTLIGELVTPIP